MFIEDNCRGRIITTLILAVIIVAGGLSSTCKSMEKKKTEPVINLRYEISGDSVYVVGDSVKIEFALYNLTDDSLFFLKWYTPFEGILGKIFEVEFNGEKLPYLGRMVKRGNPVIEDYIGITPRDKAVTRVDLSKTYDFSVPGEYKVGFRGVIDDVRTSVGPEMKPEEPHNMMNIPGNEIKFQIRD